MNKNTGSSNPVASLKGLVYGITMGLALATPVQANVNISNVPLFLTATVDPNIMFILDDSGSMQWEAMPDSLIYTYYLFPRPAGLYGSSVYDSRILGFFDTDIANVHVRSAHNNTVFYNPAIDYEPWSNPDGSLYTDADPTDALHNPANTALGGVDLTSQQSYSRWRHWNGTNWVYENSTSRDFYPITFYVYKGSGNIWSTSSYDKYQIRGSNGYKRDLNGGTEASVTSFTWPGGVTVPFWRNDRISRIGIPTTAPVCWPPGPGLARPSAVKAMACVLASALSTRVRAHLMA